MRQLDETTQELWRIAESVCTGAGYELVDLRLVQSPAGWVLRVFIDFPPAPEADAIAYGKLRAAADPDFDADADGPLEARIGFDDCERVSRELSAALDVEDPIEHTYSLEVSSPGLDRPLRTAAHFRRFLGQQAKIELARDRVADGRRNFTGTLIACEDGAITVSADGAQFALQIADIRQARLVPDWDALFGGGNKTDTKRAPSGRGAR
jgi:ribosome maturation factor RimP